MKLEFLKPEKIRDAKRRLKNDPNYDPKTVYVPEDFKNGLTPVNKLYLKKKVNKTDHFHNRTLYTVILAHRLFDNGGK